MQGPWARAQAHGPMAIHPTVSGRILLFLEGSYCFWKDTTVSGRILLFLEGYYCFWKDKIWFWKDTNIEFGTFWSVVRDYGLRICVQGAIHPTIIFKGLILLKYDLKSHKPKKLTSEPHFNKN